MRRDMSPAGLRSRLMTRGSREYRTDMKRRAAWIAGIVVLAGVVAALTLGGARRSTGQAKYETVKVERGRIIARVTASGTLSALVTVQVGTQVSGRIQDLYVDFNSPVRRGQILAKIDPQFFKAAVEQAKANLAAAEGNIAQALKKMQVDTNVSEADVGKLSAGMPTSFNVDAFPGETFKGVIRQIRNAPQSVQNVVTYDAVIDVDNSDMRLRPGMTANVTFTYAQKDDALRFPNAALRFRPPAEIAAAAPRPERDRRIVWVLRDGKPKPVIIRTGLSDGSVTEAAEGDLREGDALVTEAVGIPGSNVPPAFRRPL